MNSSMFSWTQVEKPRIHLKHSTINLVDMLLCGSNGRWYRLSEHSIPLAASVTKTVIIHDSGPCWWPAEASAKNATIDLRDRSGGEVILVDAIIGNVWEGAGSLHWVPQCLTVGVVFAVPRGQGYSRCVRVLCYVFTLCTFVVRLLQLASVWKQVLADSQCSRRHSC